MSTLAVQLGDDPLRICLTKLAPDFKRLNPMSRLMQLPRQNVPQLFQAMVLLPVVSVRRLGCGRRQGRRHPAPPLVPLEAGTAYVAVSIKELLWKAVGLFVLCRPD